jgi:hypothetical protein
MAEAIQVKRSGNIVNGPRPAPDNRNPANPWIKGLEVTE